MIYYKNLQTNDIITFENQNSIGGVFYDENLYKKLTKKESDLYQLTKLINTKCQEVDSLRDSLIDSKVINCPCKDGFINLKTDKHTQLKLTSIDSVFTDKNINKIEIPFLDTIEKVFKNITEGTLTSYKTQTLTSEGDVFYKAQTLKDKIRACKTIEELNEIDIIL